MTAGSVLFVLAFLELFLRGREPDMNAPFDGTLYAVQAPPEMIDAFTWDGEGNSLAHVRSDNPLLVYELRPGVQLNEFISINSLGFRDYEYSNEKPANTYRICVVGDSITFGWWERLEETYPKVLEELLNAHVSGEMTVEVWNMGIGGYNAEQEMELVRTRAMNYDPDLIIIGYCTNDHQIGADGGLWRHFTRSGSHAWDWISLRWMQARELFVREKMLARSYRRISEIASAADIPVMAVFFYPQNPAPQSLREVASDIALAERLGLIIVDLRSYFEEAGWENTMSDSAHPNKHGHRIAARAIYDTILEHDLMSEDVLQTP